jgi:hypothetical protein
MTKSVPEERQLTALEALISARLPALRNGPTDAPEEGKRADATRHVDTLVEWLVQDVIHSSGERVIPQSDVRDKVSELIGNGAFEALKRALVEQGAPDADACHEAGTVNLVLMVLRVLAPRYQMHFGEAAAQILYRHRKAEALQDRCHRRAVEDMSWMVPGTLRHRADVHMAVEETFRALSVDRSGVLDSRQWHRIVRFMQRKDPDLKFRLKAADCDILFYTGTHHGGEATVGVTSSEFKALLAELADTIRVHPYQVLKAVGSFSEHLDHQAPTPPTDN